MTGQLVSPDVAFGQSALGQLLASVRAEGSASHRSIADYLIRNPVRGTALKIEEMAEGCKVSTATISRFARDIGFASYGAMRSALAETLHSAIHPVDRLRSTIIQSGASANPGQTSLEYARANVAATQGALSQRALEQAVRAVSGARTVYVLGLGMSAGLASMLARHLLPFCEHVVDLAGPGGTETAAGRLVHIRRGDVLVAISLPRYSTGVMRMAQFARDHKATVVTITDTPSAPMVELSDHVLYACSAHVVLASSNVATMAIIEALMTQLMVSNRGNVKKMARLRDITGEYMMGDTV
jgi:DNA-binding MurR/RpiR family transcriptional regulator